jgi:hypothetical protein
MNIFGNNHTTPIIGKPKGGTTPMHRDGYNAAIEQGGQLDVHTNGTHNQSIAMVVLFPVSMNMLLPVLFLQEIGPGMFLNEMSYHRRSVQVGTFLWYLNIHKHIQYMPEKLTPIKLHWDAMIGVFLTTYTRRNFFQLLKIGKAYKHTGWAPRTYYYKKGKSIASWRHQKRVTSLQMLLYLMIGAVWIESKVQWSLNVYRL